MSYTPPAGNATNFTFGSTYTLRNGLATNFYFAEPVFTPTSINGTTFGTPLRRPPQSGTTTSINATAFGTPFIARNVLPYSPTTTFGTPSRALNITSIPLGWVTTVFGEPTLPPPRTAVAQGMNGTTFGTPNSPYPITLTTTGARNTTFGTPNVTGFYVTGFQLIYLGTPAVFNAYNVSTTSSSTTFGTPILKFDRTGSATGISSTVIASPWGYVTPKITPSGIYCAALPVNTTRFGTPTSLSPSVQTVSGILATSFGTPVFRRTSVATGFTATTHGAHRANTSTTPTSINTTTFGTPRRAHATVTTSLFKGAKFGTPALKGFSPHNTYGWRRTWFGTPLSTDNPNRVTSGWACASYGAAVAFTRNKALHTAPSCRFGTPLTSRVLP